MHCLPSCGSPLFLRSFVGSSFFPLPSIFSSPRSPPFAFPSSFQDYDEEDREFDQRDTEAEALRRVQSARNKDRAKEDKEQAMLVKSTGLYKKPTSRGKGGGAEASEKERESFQQLLRGSTPSEEGAMQI